MTYYSHFYSFYRYSDPTGVEVWNFSKDGWTPSSETIADVASECRVATEADVNEGIKEFMAKRASAEQKPDQPAK